ncbi:host attachment protein [Dyella amyloliquefaciens]|uniref:host attachment protein n=1 Tax=Dyella amyloliquefaciens TaxID=1770545 RepID=UPI00102EBB19|nr:host attachment protein [Dyella amyloliquefaciens]
MKKIVWIVVANRAAARLFQASQPMGPLEELDAFIHPEGRLQEHDLVSDRPGRSFDSYGAGRHAEDPDTAATEQEATNFAVQLSRFLHKARCDRKFDALVLVAAPAFLGALRDRLDVATRERITHEIDKNLVQQSPSVIRGHLPERLYSSVGA